LKRAPKRYQDPVLWVRHNLKDPAKAPTVDLLRLNSLKDTKTAF